jgi:translocation and assembly module TamA
VAAEGVRVEGPVPLSCKRRLSAVSAAALLAALWMAAPAAAFELFGIKFFEGKKDEAADDVIGEPQPYEVGVTVTADDKSLEKKLRNSSSLWADRDKPASGEAGLLAKARGDYRRLLAALYSEGRYGGSISIRIDGREAADMPPDTVLPDPAQIQIDIDAGPLFLFGRTEIVNRAPPPLDRRDEVKAPEKEGFLPGEVARSGVVLTAEKLAVEAWREQGHAKAEIADRRVTAAHEQDLLDAILTVEPGRKAYYGPVTVEGTQAIDPVWLAWMTGLEPGQEYDPDDLDRASKRLGRLDVFRAMRLKEADAIGEDGLLPIDLIVQDRLARRFGVGASFSTLDGAGFEAYWLHRNLFGRAERLRLEARIAGIGAFDPNDLTYRAGATFIKPGVITPDTNFVASLIGDREVLEPYTRASVNVAVGFTHIFTEEWSGHLSATGGVARFDDDFGEREFAYAGLLGGIVYDSRDNKTDATEGFFAEAIADPYYEFNYGHAVARFTLEGRTYYGFGEDNRVVLAGRLKMGSLSGSPISETAPDKLFFAGGGGSVRGYAYRNIGLPSPLGGVIGGRSLIEGSAEVRLKVTDAIGVVGFADAGYVGADPIPRFTEDLRVGVGAGLRYLTGLGPIRLDVAFPLDPRPGDPDVAFYVGIGQAF